MYREGAQVDGAELHRIAEETASIGVGALQASKFIARAGNNTGVLFPDKEHATQFKNRVEGLDYIMSTTVVPVNPE